MLGNASAPKHLALANLTVVNPFAAAAQDSVTPLIGKNNTYGVKSHSTAAASIRILTTAGITKSRPTAAIPTPATLVQSSTGKP